MIWYEHEEKEEPEPESRLEIDDVNVRKVLDILVQDLIKGVMWPPNIKRPPDTSPIGICQALDGVSIGISGIPPSDNSLEIGQMVTYNNLAVEVLDVTSLPCQTIYEIKLHYKG